MSWLRLNDLAATDPKIVGLTDAAFRLWIEGLSYCSRHLTDGAIVAGALRSFVASPAASSELVDAGLWVEMADLLATGTADLIGAEPRDVTLKVSFTGEGRTAVMRFRQRSPFAPWTDLYFRPGEPIAGMFYFLSGDGSEDVSWVMGDGRGTGRVARMSSYRQNWATLPTRWLTVSG